MKVIKSTHEHWRALVQKQINSGGISWFVNVKAIVSYMWCTCHKLQSVMFYLAKTSPAARALLNAVKMRREMWFTR